MGVKSVLLHSVMADSYRASRWDRLLKGLNISLEMAATQMIDDNYQLGCRWEARGEARA